MDLEHGNAKDSRMLAEWRMCSRQPNIHSLVEAIKKRKKEIEEEEEEEIGTQETPKRKNAHNESFDSVMKKGE